MRKAREKHQQLIKCLWIVFLGLTICLLSVISSPVEALWIGQSQVNPFIEVQGVYESNILRVSDDQEEDSDFITVISPGIHFEFPTTKDSVFRAVGNYRADIRIFTNDGDSEIDPDGELNTIDHRLDGRLQFNLASGVRFATGYVLNLTSEPPDYRGDEREEYADHLGFAEVAYAFADRYEIQLRYDGNVRSYDDVDSDDFTKHGVEATAFYKLFPRLSILAGGSYRMIDREEPLFVDSTEYTGFGGVKYEVTERLTSYLKVGALVKDFDDGSDDATEAYASGQLIANFSEDTSLSVRVYRNIKETSVSDESDINGAYYIVTGIDANVTHTLAALPNLSLSGSFAYNNEDYAEDEINDRSDDNFEFGVGIDYKFLKYLSIGASYEYSMTDSNVDTHDFTDNIAMMKIRAIL